MPLAKLSRPVAGGLRISFTGADRHAPRSPFNIVPMALWIRSRMNGTIPIQFNAVHFSKREILAMHFAAAFVRSRDPDPSHSGRSNRAVVLDSFSLADAFLDPRNRSFTERLGEG